MKKILLFIACCCTLICQGQDYRCVNSSSYYLYLEEGENPIHNAFAVTSVEVSGEDSIYHLTKQLRVLEESPYYDSIQWATPEYQPLFDLYGANFTGHFITGKANGDFLFFNTENEPILIKTKAMLNDTWVCYTYPNGDYIEASVFSHDLLTFLSVTDSVKKISFITKSSTDDLIEGNMAGLELFLSKNHGMVKTLKFYLFPDKISRRYHNYSEGEPFVSLTLTGKSNPQIGMKNITAKEAFNYNIGDEFHYYLERYYFSDATFSYYHTSQAIHEITGKSETDSTYQYEYSYCWKKKTTFYPEGSISDTSAQGTSTMIIKKQANEYSLYNYLFQQSVAPDFYISYDSLNGKDGKRLTSTVLQVFMCDSIATFPFAYDISSFRQSIFEGIGGIYYVNPPLWAIDNRSEYKLKYYKKGDQLWGTPYQCSILLSVPDQENSFSVKLFPNPVVSVLYIKSEEAIIDEVDIYDITGRLILKEPGTKSGKITINVEHLRPGIYIAKMISGKNMTVSRFVKQ